MTRARCILLLVVLALTGCGYETLYTGLDERQANEMLALLLGDGLDARKGGVEGNWRVLISRSDVPAGIGLLSAEGYPRERFDSLGDVFRKEGFVSSPMEERARLLHALSQELAKTMSSIDGVIAARVHLAIPERSVLGETANPSSASIFIKHRPGADVTNQAASLKALAVTSIEGLHYNNVTVTFFAAAPRHQPATPHSNSPITMAGIELPGGTYAVLAAATLIPGLAVFLFGKRRRTLTPVRRVLGESGDAK